MAIKHAQIEHETLRRLYLDIGDLADCAPDDPRLPALADRVAAFIEAAAAEAEGMRGGAADQRRPGRPARRGVPRVLPLRARLLELLEERGWTGWTNIRRKTPA